MHSSHAYMLQPFSCQHDFAGGDQKKGCQFAPLSPTLCCTPVYRNANSVVYLVLTILQINLSSSLSIIGLVTEVKQVLVGHRTQNCHLSDVVIFNVYISHIRLWTL